MSGSGVNTLLQVVTWPGALSGACVYNAWNIYFISGNIRCINLISLPLIHISQAVPGAAGFHLRKGRGTEESWEAVCVRFKPVLTCIRNSEVSTTRHQLRTLRLIVASPKSILGKRSSDMYGARMYAAEWRLKLKVPRSKVGYGRQC